MFQIINFCRRKAVLFVWSGSLCRWSQSQASDPGARCVSFDSEYDHIGQLGKLMKFAQLYVHIVNFIHSKHPPKTRQTFTGCVGRQTALRRTHTIFSSYTVLNFTFFLLKNHFKLFEIQNLLAD